MKSTDFIAAALRAAALPSCYMLGPWGWTCTDAMIDRATTQGPNAVTNQKWRPEAIKCRDKGGYIWDCVGLIKGILWGWSADRSKKYGGAGYACNGVPDYGADQMIRACQGGGSTDWSRIDPGEVVWMPGHIGIYVGGGVVIEATPKWSNGVQKSALLNIPEGQDLGWSKGRKWTRHGKLPYVEYTNTDTDTVTSNTDTDTTPSPWAMDAWNAAKKAGITDGTHPHGTATREQTIAMLYRCGVIPSE